MKFFDYQVFKQKFLNLISLNESSTRLAVSFAIGLFVSFSPLYGAHTVIGFALVLLFHMNLPAMMLGVWVNGPISAPFVYAGLYYFGHLVLGGDIIDMSLSWEQLLTRHFEDVVIQVTFGWMTLGLAVCLLSYWIVKISIDGFRRKRQRVAHQDIKADS